jgi:hypothetical protein
MNDQRMTGIPHRDGVHQNFERVSAVAEDIAKKAMIYREHADRLKRLVDQQDVTSRV